MLLDEIVKAKHQEIVKLKKKLEQVKLPPVIEMPKLRDFKSAINQAGKISLIAEIKKASPSAGEIIKSLDPASISKNYLEAGASAISVLTDQKFFKGKAEHLKQAKEAVSIPILRKDFIIDESQVIESRLIRADAILLIVRLLDQGQLEKLVNLAQEYEMAALVEVRSEKEVEMALQAKAEIIGINNRDLDTLKVDFNTSLRISQKYAELKNKILVSESGINSHSQIDELKSAGFNAVLIGESILKNKSPQAKIKELMGQ